MAIVESTTAILEEQFKRSDAAREEAAKNGANAFDAAILGLVAELEFRVDLEKD